MGDAFSVPFILSWSQHKVSRLIKTTCLAFLNILILSRKPREQQLHEVDQPFPGRFRLCGLRKKIWSGVEKQRGGWGLFFSSLFFAPTPLSEHLEKAFKKIRPEVDFPVMQNLVNLRFGQVRFPPQRLTFVLVALPGGAGGLLLGIFGGGVPLGSPNLDPVSDQKNIIFHTRFQIRALKFIPVFRPGALQPEIWSANKKILQIHFELVYFSFFLTHFGIETINTFIHSRSSLKNHIRFQSRIGKAGIPFFRPKRRKNRARWAAHI